MDWRELARGLQTGLGPSIQQGMQEKAAGKEQTRQLQYMQKLGKLQLQQKQLAEQMQFENTLSRLQEALGGVPMQSGMSLESLAGLGASGMDIGKYLPLSPMEQEKFGLEKEYWGARKQAAEAATASERAQQARAQKGISIDEAQNLKVILSDLMEERKYYMPKQVLDSMGYVQELPGDPEKLRRIDEYIRQIRTMLVPRYGQLQEQKPASFPGPGGSFWGEISRRRKDARQEKAARQIKQDTGIDPTENEIQRFLQKYPEF